MKIAIIGNAGSGKSTLSVKLHNILDIPVYHLDQYFWKPGWQEPDRSEFEKIHHALCDQDEWIIEGMAIRFLEYRIQKADIVIFLDMPTYTCFYRIFKRAITWWNQVYFSSAKGCPERGPDRKFLKYVWRFTRDKKPLVQDLLQKHAGNKKIFVVKNQRGLEQCIANFSQDLQ